MYVVADVAAPEDRYPARKRIGIRLREGAIRVSNRPHLVQPRCHGDRSQEVRSYKGLPNKKASGG